MPKKWELKFTGSGGSTKEGNAEPYLASPDLIRAVNMAIYLERPLLIEGEAGCGKTRLAYAVAAELGLSIHVWQIDSRTRAQDGLYTYDALLRLHDVQLRKAAIPAIPPIM